MNLTIAVISDFICPWCLVADVRLKQAIEQLGSSVTVQQVWYPFELNPDMPVEGMDRKIYRSQKFGSWEYSQLLDAKTVEAAQVDGIEFHYDLMQVTPNTLNAHRLTWLAGQAGRSAQMGERILVAYFTEGKNISEVEILIDLAVEVGIDRNKAETFLLSEQGIHEVKELEKQVSKKGIHGVPAIQIGKKILSGAQSTEIFLDALRTATHERANFMSVGSSHTPQLLVQQLLHL